MSLEDTLYPLLRVYEAAPQPVKSLVGRAYRTLPSRVRLGKAYEDHLATAQGVEHWDAAQIEHYQIAALRDALLAAAEAPFYKECFAAAGVDPAKFESLEQLRAYPLLNKQDMLQYRDALCNPRIEASRRLYLTTGGSSGVPVGFYLHKGVSRPKEQAYLETQWSRRGYRAGDRVAVIRGASTTSRADGRISTYDATRNWLILSSSHLTEARLPEYVAALNAFQPRHLHMYPSAALLLVRGMEALGLHLDFQPVSVLCGSEKLASETQASLEKALGCHVFHWYGHSERVVLAGQGRSSNDLYFWPTYGYVEFGEPDASGHCEVIGTSFHNHAMPLIRYRTGDYVKLADPAGRELPWSAVSEVVGREYEFLVSSTGRQVSLTTINRHDDLFDDLYAVQFAQFEPGRVEFRYQPGARFHSSREAGISTALQKKLGDDFTLSLRALPELEKTSAGKHRWLVTS